MPFKRINVKDFSDDDDDSSLRAKVLETLSPIKQWERQRKKACMDKTMIKPIERNEANARMISALSKKSENERERERETEKAIRSIFYLPSPNDPDLTDPDFDFVKHY